jgi:hypothetical protein
MYYCSIEDAWGQNISTKYKEYMTNSNNEKEEQINENLELLQNDSYNKYNNIDCDKFIAHYRICEKCQNRIRNEIRPNLIISLKKLIDNNNDIIVLILAGISILLFFNLINNLTKN